MSVGRGEKIALLGPNGVGKSSLLKVIMNQIEYDGTVEYGHNVGIGYFAQDQAEKLDPTRTIFETVDHVAKGEIRLQMRSLLGTFLFSGEDIHKKVGVLSGGERTRLALCQMLLSPSNFLILDEPTNHLDIPSKEILKNALVNYEGTFLIVSHDREFLSGLTNRIWDIENQGLKIHHFELDEYLKYKTPGEVKETVKKAATETKTAATPNVPKVDRERERKLQKTEQQISETESKIKNVENQIAETSYEAENYPSLLNEYQNLSSNLERLMVEWEKLAE
jgi:ATP-binding cassette subfamily F protein 3